MERLIVKDFRNELKGHKERLQQSRRVRNMLDTMQDRAKKLVGTQPWHYSLQTYVSYFAKYVVNIATEPCMCLHQAAEASTVSVAATV